MRIARTSEKRRENIVTGMASQKRASCSKDSAQTRIVGESKTRFMRLLARFASAAFLPALAVVPTIARAQNPAIITDLPGCDFRTGNMDIECIPIFIGHLIQTIFGLISVFFILNVIYAGYEIATGAWSGDRTAGKDRLKWSIVGLIVSACSYLILNLVVTVISP